jgi:Asp/Glu/hydantoin racemase
MTMRIWHQSAAPFGAMGLYSEALQRHINAIVSPGTEVVFHGLDPSVYAGHPPADVLKYAYPRHLILSQIIENCIQAERDGFDAIAIAAFNDPFVREARSAVDIPIVSMAETSMLIACNSAKRFALVTLTPENVWRLREIVERHGLERRVSGIYSIEPRTTERELLQGFTEPKAVAAVFTRAAERAIADGAELIIAAEGVLNELLYAHKFHRVHMTPVLDCVGGTFLYAELMVRLYRTSALRVSRTWDHAKPEATLIAEIRRATGKDS